MSDSFKNNTQIIGIIYIKERQSDLDGVDIFHVAIKKDTRNKGAGKKMLQLMFEIIKKRNRQFAFTSTNQTNEDFYKKCGMKKFGKISKTDVNSERSYLYKKIM